MKGAYESILALTLHQGVEDKKILYLYFIIQINNSTVGEVRGGQWGDLHGLPPVLGGVSPYCPQLHLCDDYLLLLGIRCW